MTLRRFEVARLESRGYRDFVVEDPGGHLRLRNVDGHCVFLVGGGCSIYPWRPEGCVLYPLVLFEEDDEVDLDPFCPHRHEFRFSSGDHAWVRRSVTADDAEAAERARTRVRAGYTGNLPRRLS
jgi:Fe-S-cluster containining protein